MAEQLQQPDEALAEVVATREGFRFLVRFDDGREVADHWLRTIWPR